MADGDLLSVNGVLAHTFSRPHPLWHQYFQLGLVVTHDLAPHHRFLTLCYRQYALSDLWRWRIEYRGLPRQYCHLARRIWDCKRWHGLFCLGLRILSVSMVSEHPQLSILTARHILCGLRSLHRVVPDHEGRGSDSKNLTPLGGNRVWPALARRLVLDRSCR